MRVEILVFILTQVFQEHLARLQQSWCLGNIQINNGVIRPWENPDPFQDQFKGGN